MDQIEIKKTSKEWYEDMRKTVNITIYDPDGWDRTNYEYSFNEELITKSEFDMRVASSTCIIDRDDLEKL